MLKKLLMVVAMSAVTATAFAVDAAQVEKSIELKDGSTVYIFKDGKMGMDFAGGPGAIIPGYLRSFWRKQDQAQGGKSGQGHQAHQPLGQAA